MKCNLTAAHANGLGAWRFDGSGSFFGEDAPGGGNNFAHGPMQAAGIAPYWSSRFQHLSGRSTKRNGSLDFGCTCGNRVVRKSGFGILLQAPTYGELSLFVTSEVASNSNPTTIKSLILSKASK